VEFFDYFAVPEAYISVAVGKFAAATYSEVPLPPADYPQGVDVFFSPAPRRSKGDTKEDVLGGRVLWVDVDNLQLPQSTYPASAIVNSGHGWHMYWFLTHMVDPEMLERCNKVLIKDIPTADKACWNANRFMRIPGTTNMKNPDEPVTVRLHRLDGHIYTPQEFDVLEKLDSKTRHKIRTGDRRGYHSRSERDWVVITEMVAAGAEDGIIEWLFKTQPVGDKVNDSETPDKYLTTTITEARSRTARTSSSGIEEQPDGYYAYSRRGSKRLSTFTFSPRLLLDSAAFGEVDAIVGSVRAAGYEWGDVTFTRSAFTRVDRIDRETPIAAWQWLGNDQELRQLLPYLMVQLADKGMPRVIATPALGLYNVGGVWYFVGDRHTLSKDECWGPFSGPIAALPTGKERPRLELENADRGALQMVADLLPEMNSDESIWTMIGWYFASPLKPYLESQGIRFPILNVTGTRGSGKTTLIQRVFLPLLGQVDAKSYDAGTTRFVTLALLGSTNAVPVAFSEFRFANVGGFLRYILLAYDTGHDPRGRSDQTTKDYPLSAPFSLDGEDLVSDPACQERIVACNLHPADIREGTIAYEAYRAWSNACVEGSLVGVARYYIQWLLAMLTDGEVARVIESCRNRSYVALPARMPERVRSNYTVAYIGINLFCQAFGVKVPDFDVLGRSVRIVFNTESGRSRTIVDDFVEELVNDISTRGGIGFNWERGDSGGQIWFQLSATHSWWLANLRRQGRAGLERDAIRSQLKEVEYILSPMKFRGTLMYGVDLALAQQTGLDVPVRI